MFSLLVILLLLVGVIASISYITARPTDPLAVQEVYEAALLLLQGIQGGVVSAQRQHLLAVLTR